MRLRREPGTCFWCGDRRGPHPWKICPANGKSCTSCGGNDHFARVCLEDRKPTSPGNRPTWRQQSRDPQNSQKRDPRANLRPRDLHYTDMYAKEERHESPYDQDYGYMYSLEAQVHSIATIEKAKRYFTNLSLSAAGHTFMPVKFQIDTAATCNTMSASTLRSLFPDAEITRSPYRLHPYGNSKPLHPIVHVELLWETHNKFDTLTFQVLPDSCIGIKPALLSGSDSERLGLVSVKTTRFILFVHRQTITLVPNTMSSLDSSLLHELTPTHHSAMPKPREP